MPHDLIASLKLRLCICVLSVASIANSKSRKTRRTEDSMRWIIVTLFLCLFVSPAIQVQRTSSSSAFPPYDNGGKPDLTIDPKQQESQMSIVDRYFDPQRDACVFNEGAVGGSGYRRLLRFDTV